MIIAVPFRPGGVDTRQVGRSLEHRHTSTYIIDRLLQSTHRFIHLRHPAAQPLECVVDELDSGHGL